MWRSGQHHGTWPMYPVISGNLKRESYLRGERGRGERKKQKIKLKQTTTTKKPPFLWFSSLSKLRNKRQKPCLVFCVSANYIPAAVGQFQALHPTEREGLHLPAVGRPFSPAPGMPPRGSALLFWQSLFLLPGRAPSHFSKGSISTLSYILPCLHSVPRSDSLFYFQ